MSPVPTVASVERLLLMPQEMPLDHPESSCRFRSPLIATQGAILEFGYETIAAHYQILMEKAERHGELDRLQMFRDLERLDRRLLFIEDGGSDLHVTALLPDDY